jgi:predicted deacylase
MMVAETDVRNAIDIEATPRGQKDRFRLVVGTVPSGAALTVPVVVVRGVDDGPVLGVTSGVHGDEALAPLAIGRFAREIDPRRLRGTIIIVPIANPAAFDHRSRVNPWDGVDLVRVWPGDANGNTTERLAHSLFRNVVQQVDFLVDAHSGTPLLHEFWVIYANPKGAEPSVSEAVATRSRAAALRFGADQIIRAHPWKTTVSAAGAAGVPTILAEIGGGADIHSHAEDYIAVIMRGVANVAAHLGMLENATGSDVMRVQEFDIAEEHIAKHSGGLWSRRAQPGDSVSPGSLLGNFVDPASGEVSQEVIATRPGTILNPVVSWPMVPAGQWLMATGTLVETHEVRG